MTSFFQPGEVGDLAYRNVRDLERTSEFRDFVELLWSNYQGNEDINFLSDAKGHFQQRFWEMYLWVTMVERGFSPTKASNSGPEFSIDVRGRRFWIEAICPTAGITIDAIPSECFGEVREVEVDKILLRFTHAMSDKLQKRNLDLARNRIASSDGFILAINSRAMPVSAWAGGEIPWIVKACYPIGNLAVPIDVDTGNMGEAYYLSQTQIEKNNGAPVSTGLLLHSEYSCFSAVLHSAADCTSVNPALGADFDTVLNPLATTPVASGAFSWARNWEFIDNTLYRTDGQEKS